MAPRTPSSSPSKSDMSAATDDLYLNRYREEVVRIKAMLAASPSSSPQKSPSTAASKTSQKLPVVPTNTSVGGSQASSRSPVKSGSTTPRAKAKAADFSYMDLYRPKPAPVPGSYLDLYRPGRAAGAASETSTATPTAPISCSSIVEVPALKVGGPFQQSPLSVSNLSRMTPGSSSAASTRERSSSSVSTSTTKVYGLRYGIPPASLADTVMASHPQSSAPPSAPLKREAHSLPILAKPMKDLNAQRDEKNKSFIKAVLKSPKPRTQSSRSDLGRSELSSTLFSESSSSTKTVRPSYENSELATPSKSIIQATIRARAKEPFLRSTAENILLAERDAAKIPSKRMTIPLTSKSSREPQSPQKYAPSSQSGPQGGEKETWKDKQVERGNRSRPLGPREQQGEKKDMESKAAAVVAPERAPSMPSAVLWVAGMKEKMFKKKWEQKQQREREEKKEEERKMKARLEPEIREQLRREMREANREDGKKSPEKEKAARRQADSLERLERAQRAERERMKREFEKR